MLVVNSEKAKQPLHQLTLLNYGGRLDGTLAELHTLTSSH